MNKRNYNIFFHTHTVSGIVISVALYIIFFAGAFALIKDEITAWEKETPVQIEKAQKIDYNRVIDSIKGRGYNLYGRDVRMIAPDAKQQLYVLLSPSQDSTIVNNPDKKYYFFLDAHEYHFSEYYDFYSIGELIYRLHFFSQVPVIGIYIAGFIAVFFLFAIVTGVLIHWKKIIQNFYVFRPKKKLKTIWTDAHTVLGMIGLPFQFVFAVTSCFLCLSALVLIPANYVFDNNQEKTIEALRPMAKTYPLENKKLDTIPDLNVFMEKTHSKWENFTPAQVYIRNYGAENMKFQVDGLLDPNQKFLGNGRTIYDVASQQLISEKNPFENDYLEDVELTIRRLHFGDFGGLPLKFIYFLMALITCFVIISGVLIWLEARNKKNISASQKLYNRKVGHIYLAICLSMYPITAFSFVVAKLLPRSLDPSRETILYCVYFLGWALVAGFFRFLRNNYKTNKYSLVSGGIIGLIIPLVNGFTSGNWFWKTFANAQYEIFCVDFFWILMGCTSLWIVTKLKRPVRNIAHSDLVTSRNIEIKETVDATTLQPTKTLKFMRTKTAILWLFLAIGFIVHHIYGLFSVYYNESVMIEGATGDVPINHHLWRVALEGLALLFFLFTLEIKKSWFRWTSFCWALIVGFFNVYHFIASLFYEASNISELLILALMVLASIFLAKSILAWNKEEIKTALQNQ